MSVSKLTLEQLNELFELDISNGNLISRKKTKKFMIGDIIDTIGENGSKIVCFNNKVYRQNRIIYFMFYKEMPNGQVNYIDGNKKNNSPNNLYANNNLKEKICNSCLKIKNINDFNKHKKGKMGLRSFCKICQYQNEKKRILKDVDKHLTLKKNNRNKNKDYQIKYYKNYSKTNRYKLNSKEASRRAIKLNAMPKWLDDNQKMQIKWFYAAAKMMSESSGLLYHVDHIHPLKGNNFNGLHVPWNLQIIPAEENIRKGNKL